MKTSTLFLALLLALPLGAAAQDGAEKTDPKREDARRAARALLTWKYDGGVRFGPEIWRESETSGEDWKSQVLAKAAEQLPSGGGALLRLALRLEHRGAGLTMAASPTSFSIRAVSNTRAIAAEVDRSKVFASILIDGAEARLQRSGQRFELRLTRGDHQRRLLIAPGRAEYVEAGATKRRWEAVSFLRLYLDRQRAFEDEIFPALGRLGVPRPELPSDPRAVESLVADLLPPSAEDRAWAGERLARLDHLDPAVRGEAVKELTRRSRRLEPLLLRRLAAPGLTPGARFALAWITARGEGRDAARLARARRAGFFKDARFRALVLKAAPIERRAELARILDNQG